MINSWHAPLPPSLTYSLTHSHVLQLETNVALPPPEALKGKIIIKNKKKHVEKQIGEHALNPASSSPAAPRLAPQIAAAAAGSDGSSASAAEGSDRTTLNEPAVNDLGE